MRFGTIRAVVLAFASSLPVAAVCAQSPAMSPPKPPAELSQLAFFVGDWTCTGKTFATPMGPEHATQGTVHARRAIGDFWYIIHYDETKADTNPTPYSAAMAWGYDAGEQAFIFRCYDSFGGYCAETGKGWTGDTFVLEGQQYGMGPKMNVRDTFTRKSATELMHSSEMQGSDGKWTKVDEETCRKEAEKR